MAFHVGPQQACEPTFPIWLPQIVSTYTCAPAPVGGDARSLKHDLQQAVEAQLTRLGFCVTHSGGSRFHLVAFIDPAFADSPSRFSAAFFALSRMCE